jgi:hypothetical protein
MKIVPNDYCNECKKDTGLIVTGMDEHSVFAKCPVCGAKFDLIREGTKVVESFPSVYDFKTLPEAISFYTRTVAEVMKARDRDMHNELMRFKKELHERIGREYDPAAL